MQASQIDLLPFSADHLDGALALSQQAGWPHRREDWAFVLSVSKGFVAVENGKVVATAMATLYGETYATINMVIVDAAMRGRGLGRKIMDMALDAATGRECRLVATEDGLPLYEKLGFVAKGEIVQHQGIVTSSVAAPSSVSWVGPDVADAVIALDKQAFGADRSALFAQLFERGRFAVLRDGSRISGFICLRQFGRGEVAGPLVASSAEEAKVLLSFVFAECSGRFLRVDTLAATGLAPWLIEHRLVHVGGGVPMRRALAGAAEATPAPVSTFALTSQALG